MEILYGVNNEIYNVESINEQQIIVKYLRKIHITYNLGSDEEVSLKEEKLYFSKNDIGIKIFFKDGDCYKSLDELYEDKDYSNYKENLENRMKLEEEKE